MIQLSTEQAHWLASARIAHLATADSAGSPQVVPVCYTFDGQTIYSVLDQKPKRTSPLRLRRVRNIQVNPRVSLLVDHYEEDWRRLGYLMVMGRAELLLDGDERIGAIRLLRQKYPQYQDMDIDANPVIKISPTRVTAWGSVPS